jgi:hypothetical protein
VASIVEHQCDVLLPTCLSEKIQSRLSLSVEKFLQLGASRFALESDIRWASGGAGRYWKRMIAWKMRIALLDEATEMIM